MNLAQIYWAWLQTKTGARTNFVPKRMRNSKISCQFQLKVSNRRHIYGVIIDLSLKTFVETPEIYAGTTADRI